MKRTLKFSEVPKHKKSQMFGKEGLMYKMSAALLFAAIFVSSAMAQGDPRFCGNYAHNAASLGDAVMKKNAKCLDLSRGLHPDYKSHFDWCMRQLPSSVQGAEANIRRLAS